MTSDVSIQVEAFTTPGTLLRRARLAAGFSEREVEDQLNLMPGYVAILERDDYQSLRSPAFARGYVRAYAQLMKLDEAEVLGAFDEQREHWEQEKKRIQTNALQLQSTGIAIVVGLLILALLFFTLWWWKGRDPGLAVAPTVIHSDAMVAGTEIPAGEQ